MVVGAEGTAGTEGVTGESVAVTAAGAEETGTSVTAGVEGGIAEIGESTTGTAGTAAAVGCWAGDDMAAARGSCSTPSLYSSERSAHQKESSECVLKDSLLTSEDPEAASSTST